MPRRLASGANTCSDSLASACPGSPLLAAKWRRVCRREARRSMTTRKIARKRQQHLAHVFGLAGREFGHRALAGGRRCRVQHGQAFFFLLGLHLGGLDARLALQLHQLGGLQGERGKVLAEGLGNDLLRPVQVLAGIDEVGRGLHGLRAANVIQDAGHGIGVGQDVFTRVELFVGQQGFGERPGAHQGLGLMGQARRRGRDDGRRHRRRCLDHLG